MNDAYALLKTVHILSSTLLFGTGLGTAFFFWLTHRSGQPAAIAVAARLTVRADTLFTTPAVIVQPLSGYLLMRLLGFDWHTPWLQAAAALYLLAGACWLPVVWLQWRACRLADAALRDGTALPPAYHRCMRIWFALGWPAFLAVLATFWLMVAKPPLWG
ncbi:MULTISPECIES: DUF2269 family protein [Rhodanobacter]|uniref:DUF2269 family protein n=1 Tax=Rhodanobacter TaxID=75309 RepID=UPI0004154413|nr:MULTISPECIES: DUF2269 domain-containing protein [Rhodanobacter]KZC20501.1 hypothetical protein RHOFW104R3_25360 [Rhodanobacter denitrificans]UJJ50724.1 DUF2269 domain-containing protein [Rhodanobacter denitrificans]UJM93438.1 DUF2269 domain-containing protein [Rhodanobacter denitrificans]UJM96970.1 DUF2269 domain-containing protein [Rhodanobacter denitrificans]UJN20203.1 DUF2269 domain-containing protein [Rhodanobacter denitrificans]